MIQETHAAVTILDKGDMDDGRDRQALISRKRHASFDQRILRVNEVRNGLRTSSCANRRSIAICATNRSDIAASVPRGGSAGLMTPHPCRCII